MELGSIAGASDGDDLSETIEPVMGSRSVGLREKAKLAKLKYDERRRLILELDFHKFFHPENADDDEKSGSGAGAGSGSVFTDKLFEKFLSLVAPLDDADVVQNKVLFERMKMQRKRPALSASIMSKNTTLLNARLSTSFEMLDHIINFFNWSNPYYTIGIQLIGTHLVLNPSLLMVLPIFLIVSQILVPHYLMIYPPDKTQLTYFDQNPIPSYNQLEKSKIPQPVNQFSREFYMNLTDLQNAQVLYIELWDFVVWLTNDYLYFKNENLSSVVCLILISSIPVNLFILPKFILFLLQRIYLIQACVLLLIWIVPILLHPDVRSSIVTWIYREETRINTQHKINYIELYFCSFLVRPEDKYQIKDWIDHDVHEVEIFELQKFDNDTKIWDLKGFSNNFYTINSPIRKYNQELKDNDDITDEHKSFLCIKKNTIDDIVPPLGWRFIESKWTLDLDVSGWVEDNLIPDLVSIDEDEKWVYDYNDESDLNQSIYRRRRWLRTCRRETFHDRKEKDSE